MCRDGEGEQESRYWREREDVITLMDNEQDAM